MWRRRLRRLLKMVFANFDFRGRTKARLSSVSVTNVNLHSPGSGLSSPTNHLEGTLPDGSS